MYSGPGERLPKVDRWAALPLVLKRPRATAAQPDGDVIDSMLPSGQAGPGGFPTRGRGNKKKRDRPPPPAPTRSVKSRAAPSHGGDRSPDRSGSAGEAEDGASAQTIHSYLVSFDPRPRLKPFKLPERFNHIRGLIDHDLSRIEDFGWEEVAPLGAHYEAFWLKAHGADWRKDRSERLVSLLLDLTAEQQAASGSAQPAAGHVTHTAAARAPQSQDTLPVSSQAARRTTPTSPVELLAAAAETAAPDRGRVFDAP